MKILLTMFGVMLAAAIYAEDPSEARAADICRAALRRHATLNSQKGGLNSELNQPAIQVVPEMSAKYSKNVYRCRIGKKFRMIVDPDGSILEFVDTQDDSPVVKGEAASDKTTEWTTEEVVAKATDFARAVIGKWPEDLGAPTVERLNGVASDGPNRLSEWRVTWPRLDKTGYRFYSDSLGVTLRVEYGGVSLSANLTSQFSGVNFVLKTKSDAQKIALQCAEEKLKRSTFLYRYFGDSHYILKTPVADDICIIRPDNFLEADVANVSRSVKSRLAWMFVFSVGKTPGGRGANGIIIFVDAETGKCISGDAY